MLQQNQPNEPGIIIGLLIVFIFLTKVSANPVRDPMILGPMILGPMILGLIGLMFAFFGFVYTL
jgi:hypothetical protein